MFFCIPSSSIFPAISKSQKNVPDASVFLTLKIQLLEYSMILAVRARGAGRRGVKLLKFFMGTKRGYGWRDVLLGMPDLARLKGSRRSSCTILPSLRLLREVHPAAAGRLRPAVRPALLLGGCQATVSVGVG